jgi:hypothetical protein
MALQANVPRHAKWHHTTRCETRLSNMAVVSHHNKRRRRYLCRAVLDGAAKKDYSSEIVLLKVYF